MVYSAVFFSNVSYDGCIGINFNRDFSTSSIEVTKNKNMVFIALYFGGQETLAPDIAYINRIQNYTVYRPGGDVSFCITNTTFNDGGDYNFNVQSQGYSGIVSLYILGKPQKANLFIQSSGTINIQPAHLLCHSQSTSSPHGLPMTYMWKVNDTDIVEGNKYHHNGTLNKELFIDVTRDDRFNEYKCGAKEERGQTSDFSKVVKIDPNVSPNVTLEPAVGQNSVIENTRLIIKCVILEAYPDIISYQWFRNNTLVNETSDTFVINNVSKKDNSLYMCSASNGLEVNGFASMNLTVLYGPVIKLVPSVSQEEGRGINITCNIESNPTATNHNVTWTKREDAQFSKKGFLLSMPHLNRFDTGTFVCTVNLTMKPTYGPLVEKSTSYSSYVNVLYGPVIRPMAAISLEEGKRINIRCDVMSNPTATDQDVTWTKQENGTFKQTGIWLIIQHANRLDQGMFNCSVTIRMNITDGQTVERSASGIVELKVFYGPVIRPMAAVSQEEGNSINISCIIMSNPSATDQDVTWTKQGNGTFCQKGVRLFIPHGNWLDQGIFNCSVTIRMNITDGENVARSASANVEITIFYGPIIMLIGQSFQEDGKSINISCDTMSNPTVTDQDVTWTKQENETFRQKGVRLFIPHANRLDQGIFNCSVTIQMNIAGSPLVLRSASANVELYIISKPPIPTFVHAICKTTSAILIWKTEFAGGSENYFRINVWKEAQLLHTALKPVMSNPCFENDHHFTVTDLLPSTSYEFVILAINEIGATASRMVNCSTDARETITISGTEFSASGIATLVIGIFAIILASISTCVRRLHKRKLPKARSQNYIDLNTADRINSYSTLEQLSELEIKNKKDKQNDVNSVHTYEECQPSSDNSCMQKHGSKSKDGMYANMNV